MAQSRGNFPEAPYYADVTKLTTGANVSLDAIQARLTELYPTASLALPAPVGFHNATDAQVNAAVAKAVADQLSGALTDVTVEQLFGAIVKVRPAQAVPLLTSAIGSLAASSVAATPAASTLLANLTQLAIGNSPEANAVPVTTAVVTAVATNFAALNGSTSLADATEAAVADASGLADKITATAIQTARANGVQSQTAAIVSAATEAAVTHGGGNLVTQIAFAAMRNGQGGSVTQKALLQAVFTGLHDGASEDRGSVFAATLGALTALAGNTASGANLISAVNESYPAYSAGATSAITTYNSILSEYAAKKAQLRRTPTTAEAGALASMRLVLDLSGQTTNADVITAAALVARPANVNELVRKAILTVPAQAGNIVETGVRANSSVANLIVTAAIVQSGVDTSGVKQANIVTRALRGAPVAQAPSITLAAIQATALSGGLNDTRLSAVLTAAVTEAAADGASIGDITTQVAKTYKAIQVGAVRNSDSSTTIIKAVVAGLSNSNLDALAQAMASIINTSAAPSRTLSTVQAAARTASLLAAAQALVGGNAAAQAQLALAANTTRDILADKVNFYATTKTALASASSAAQVTAVVYAAGVANPAGLSAIATAAAVLNPGSVPAVQAAAAAANPAAAKNVQAALGAASHVAANGGTDLFDYIGGSILENSAFTGDVVIGAVIARPDYANIIAKAAAFRAPGLSAGKVVPAIFAFGDLNRIKSGSQNDNAARVAAIMAGITSGLLDARVDVTTVPEKVVAANGQTVYNPRYQPSQTALLKENVTAVVKAALAFQSSVNYSIASTVTLNSHGQVVSNDTTPGQTTTAVGAASAITGLISQTTNYGDKDINSVTVGAIVKAAAAAAGIQYWVSIAQAASQAFVTVSGVSASTFTGVAQNTTASNAIDQTNGANIVAAIVGSMKLTAVEAGKWTTILQGAVAFGAQQAMNSAANPGNTAYLGIGAKGVVDYAHHSGTGPYVTNIFDL